MNTLHIRNYLLIPILLNMGRQLKYDYTWLCLLCLPNTTSSQWSLPNDFDLFWLFRLNILPLPGLSLSSLGLRNASARALLGITPRTVSSFLPSNLTTFHSPGKNVTDITVRLMWAIHQLNQSNKDIAASDDFENGILDNKKKEKQWTKVFKSKVHISSDLTQFLYVYGCDGRDIVLTRILGKHQYTCQIDCGFSFSHTQMIV